jgi:ABC-2 type transport system permease protein
MLSTPTPTGVVLAGEAGGRIAVAVFQAAYIVVATWLLFRVDWGQPLPTAVVVLLFCLVAGGAGMLTGATLRNESQAGGVAVGIGLVMAALGGSMVPVEVFPATLRSIALVTPPAWANRAMAEIVRRDGGLPDILPEVGVLAAYAAVLLVLATILLRRTLTR